MKAGRALALMLAVWGLSAGCPSEWGASLSSDTLNRWFQPRADPLPRCDLVTPKETISVPRELEVRVWVGRGLDVDEVERHLRNAARFWGPHGLTLVATEQSRVVDDAPLLVRATGPNAAHEAIAPLRRLIAELPARGPLHLVLLSRLAAPDAQALAELGRLDGLAFAEVTAESSRRKGQAIEPDPLASVVSGPHAAVAFVGLDGAYADTLAHEIGHALGLAHVDDGANLMHPLPDPRCRSVLTEAQRRALGLLK